MRRWVVLGLIGCGGEATDDGGAGTETGDPTDPAGTGPDLVGDWASDCLPVVAGIWAVSTATFEAAAWRSAYQQFRDPACVEGPITDMQFGGGSWQLGEAVGPTTWALDLVVDRADVVLSDAQVVGEWNAASGCGPFTEGQRTEILGQTCYGGANPPAGGTVYDLADVNAGGFAFGDFATGDRLTEAARPTRPGAIRHHRVD